MFDSVEVPKKRTQTAKPTQFEFNNFTIKCCQRKVEPMRQAKRKKKNKQNTEQHQARKLTDTPTAYTKTKRK